MKATTCRASTCNRSVLARNLCAGHYSRWARKGEDGLDAPLRYTTPKSVPRGECVVAKCPKPANCARRMCRGHYERWRRTGDVRADDSLTKVRQPCAIDGCEILASCWGYCNAHSLRVRSGGDARAAEPIKVRAPRSTDRTCKAAGCARRRKVRGYCQGHHRLWERGGEAALAAPLRIARYAPGQTCMIDTCGNRPLAKGLCRAHYWRRHWRGDVRAEVPIFVPLPAGTGCRSDGCSKPAVKGGYCSAHYLADRKAAIMADPERYEAFKAYDREFQRAVRAADPERCRRLAKARRLADPARYRVYALRRRGLEATCARIPYTAAQLAAKVAYWGHRCWVCGGPYEAIDHVKPLARGGAEILANLRPICTSDNSAKGARWPWTPAVPRGGRT